MLRATARVLRGGGRTAFVTIELAPGLDSSQRRRARDAGPRAVTARRPYRDLLERAGFASIQAEDVTEAYLATLRRWLEQTRSHEEALVEIDGAEAVRDRIDNWAGAVREVECGSLRRTLYAARRPRR